MKKPSKRISVALALSALFLTLNSPLSTAFSQGTAFTYQGALNSNGSAASGNYDLTFTLFATNITGVAIAGPVTNSATAVSNGLFTTTIDLGPGVFTGTNYWLEIAIRTNGGGAFTTLTPRQAVVPTPYAIYAAGAGSVGAANISGTIPLAQLPSVLVTNNQTGVTLSGTFTNALIANAIVTNSTFAGNGGGLTNLNARQLVLSAPGNLYVGPAGNLTNTGSGNTAVGDHSLVRDSTGFNNVAVGQSAMQNNTGGAANTGVGAGGVLNNNTIGSYNTALGGAALFSNTTGSNNTAVGLAALNGNNGTQNIALGYYAGSAFTGNESSNIDIGNPGGVGDQNVIRVGTPGIQTNTFIAGVISGDGSGLTNVNAAQVTGSFSNLSVIGSQAGGFMTPLALIQNNNTSASAAPALRVVGNGNSPSGVLSVSTLGTGLLAQFGNAFAFVADLTTNGTFEGAGFNGGTIRVGSSGTTITTMEVGQAVMPSGGSSLQETNFLITFPTAFNSSPKITFSIANDPTVQGVNDVFAASISSNSPAAFVVNVYRVNGTSWGQQLRINWMAWQ